MKKLSLIMTMALVLTFVMGSQVMAVDSEPVYLNDIVLVTGSGEDDELGTKDDVIVEYTFGEADLEYDILLESSVESISVLPKRVDLDDEAVTVTVSPEEELIGLDYGLNVVTVTVLDKGEDGVDLEEATEPNDVSVKYTFNIVRGTLDDLSVYTAIDDMEPTSMAPAFSGDILSYTLYTDVEANVTIVPVLPDVEDVEGIEYYVEVLNADGDPIASDEDGFYVYEDGEEEGTYISNLEYGSNVFDVNVVRETKTVVDNTTTIVRDELQKYELNIKVTPIEGLLVTEGENPIEVVDEFDATVFEYSASLDYGQTNATFNIDVVEALDVTDDDSENDVTFTVSYMDGDEEVVVEDPSVSDLLPGVYEYFVTIEYLGAEFVYSLSLEVSGVLSEISLSDEGTVIFDLESEPVAFDPAVFEYDVMVPVDVSNLNLETSFVIPEDVDDYDVKITLDGELIYGDVLVVPVNIGSSEMLVEVIDNDLVVETYSIQLMKQLLLEDLTIVPEPEIADFVFDFSEAKLSYKVDLPVGTTSVDLTPSVNQADAVLAVAGVGVTSGQAIQVDLEAGKTTVEVTVTFEDVVTTYKVTFDVDEKESDQSHAYDGTYGFEERFGYTLEHRYIFGDFEDQEGHEYNSYFEIVKAFKYGSNRENVIYMEYEKDQPIEIPYATYKYLVQHKVSLHLMNRDELVQVIDLKAFRLRSTIKDPKNETYVIISWDEDKEMFVAYPYTLEDTEELESTLTVKTNHGKGNKK